MQMPEDVTLPFFAYGLFKPDQLGYPRISQFVEESVESKTKGEFLERDGLPILNVENNDTVKGILFTFRESHEKEAYDRIVEIEPEDQYRWATIDVQLADDSLTANALVGKSPQSGTSPLEGDSWDGRDDPLFTAALKVIEETLEKHSGFEWDLKPLFQLQMSYLLLWSAIERYVSLKYSLKENPTKKVNHLADEPAFARALKQVVAKPRTLRRAGRPSEKYCLDANDPVKSLDYYYQVRSNITHNGKAVVRDHETVEQSLSELLHIFKTVLADAFSSQ